jgi:hypothetical protein
MGHDRDKIVQTIKEAAARDRPGEMRDWDAYATRAATVAFGIPGNRMAEYLRQRDERFRVREGRRRDEPKLLPPGGPFFRSGPER